jgi:hypothetical protein
MAVAAFWTTHREFLGQCAEFVHVNRRCAFAASKLAALV